MVGPSITLKLPPNSSLPRATSPRFDSPWSKITAGSRITAGDEERSVFTAHVSHNGIAASDASQSEAAETAITHSDLVSPNSRSIRGERTPRGIGRCDVVSRDDRREVKRGMSRLSGRTMNTIFSGAVSEAFHGLEQGLEPLSKFLVRLFKFHRCLVLSSFVMVAIGVAGGMAIEDWDFLTALYVIVQIITTIGYGDITVDKEWMKLFMTLYVLLTLVLVANFLNIFLTTIIERHAENLHRRLLVMQVAATDRLEDVKDARRRLGRYNEVIVSGVFFVSSIVVGTLFFKLVEDCSCSYGITAQQGCVDDTFEMCVETGGVNHSWITSLYLSVITVTTVGFGDYSPQTVPGRVFGLFWMTLGVAATGFFISSVSKAVAEEPGTEREISGAEAIDEALFQEMDQDGNGYLSKDEYMRYVLVRHGFITRDVLRDIDEKYSQMDDPISGMRSRKGVTYDTIAHVKTRALTPSAEFGETAC